MEKHKTIWIIFSVAFLALVVVLGVLLFLPRENSSLAEASGPVRDAEGSFDPIQWVRTSQEPPGLVKRDEEAPPEEFIVVLGEAVPERTPVVVVEQPAARDLPPVRTPVQPKASEPAKTVPVQEPAKPALKTVKGTEYWIQTGSFTSKTRAEQVRESLSSKGVVSRIVSKDVDGSNFFRVRVGPYQNKEEAEKFLGWIKGIENFENSYISQVYVEKQVESR